MLNAEQERCVKYEKYPLCVIAGPGTGKTLVLQKKIAHLIKRLDIEPYHILGLTFTTSAANELKRRVHADTLISKHLIEIGTFHSQCLKILKAYPTKCGLNEDFKWLSPELQEKRITELMQELSITWVQNYLPAIRESLSKAKKQQHWTEGDQIPYSEQLAREIYNPYQFSLIERNEIDIDDMIIKVNQMFKDYPNILEEYRQRYKYILVDEAQDLDHTQYTFLSHLKCDNTTIVGDDDQSIYGFTGSSLEYIDKFITDFDPKIITLRKNYRSTAHILQTALELIKHNGKRFQKDLKTKKPDGAKIKVLVSPNETTEAENIISLIGKGKDTAILYRQNKHPETIEKVFQENGIPYKILGGAGYYHRREIKDAIALTTLLVKDDPESFQRAMGLLTSIGPRTTEKIMNHAQATNQNFLQACTAQLSGIKEGAHANLKRFQQTYLNVKTQTFEEQAKTVLKAFLPPLNEEGQERITKFLNTLSRWNNNIEKFLKHIRYLETSTMTVKLLTIHKSKGMEFENVIISGFEQGLIPYENGIFDTTLTDIQEERRIAYVGMTRASKTLTLSYVHNRHIGKTRKDQQPSQFIKEIPQENLEYI